MSMGGKLPDLAAVVRTRLEPPRLLLRAHLEPVLDEDDAGLDHQALEVRDDLQEALRLLLGAEAHDALDARAVVPAAVEDHDLAGRGQVRQVALGVHLRLLAVGGRRQGDHAEDPRAHALRDRLDRSALPGAVAALEDDARLDALVDDPLLELHELDVQTLELLVVRLAVELLGLLRLDLLGRPASLRLPVFGLLAHGDPPRAAQGRGV
jgi:hypothetical protein